MLWLAYAQGLTHVDIAGALGVKAASVRLLLFRARQKLAALLRGSARVTGGQS
jgi:RNA polymerase sigma-70 factor (ECF subfamily)